MSDLSPIEAAKEMGVSRSLVYRLIEQGDLAAHQVSNRLQIPREGVEESPPAQSRAGPVGATDL